VFVPNSLIWSNPVINYSSGGTQRIEVDVELAQRKDVDAAIGELKKLVADEPRVLSGATLAPVVTVASYPKSGGARLRIAAWVRSPDAPLATDDLRSHARAALTEAGCAVAAS
jgi:small conductance mechanosensitive channel